VSSGFGRYGGREVRELGDRRQEKTSVYGLPSDPFLNEPNVENDYER